MVHSHGGCWTLSIGTWYGGNDDSLLISGVAVFILGIALIVWFSALRFAQPVLGGGFRGRVVKPDSHVNESGIRSLGLQLGSRCLSASLEFADVKRRIGFDVRCAAPRSRRPRHFYDVNACCIAVGEAALACCVGCLREG